MSDARPIIALVTQPLGKGGVPILQNYLKLIEPTVSGVYFITDGFPDANDGQTRILRIGVGEWGKSLAMRMMRLFWIQMKICWHLWRVVPKVPIVAFYIGSDLYLMPMMLTRFLGKKMVRFVVGRHSHFARVEYGWQGMLFSPVFRLVENVTFLLASRINVLSESAVKAMGLEKYRHKITISGAQYIDGNVFSVTKPFAERNLVGHIGGLGPRKGALNFARAIPLVTKERNDVGFVIAGPGSAEEREKIIDALESGGVAARVKLNGWIPAKEFPLRLNELRLFVLASYEEGLPAVVQQAMACGAVPVTTSVGGLPDLVKDGETGFIIEENTPPGITRSILKALSHPDLEKIARNAHEFIMREYSYERLATGCREALLGLVKESTR